MPINEQVNIRFPEHELQLLDALVAALKREHSGGKSRPDAIRHAIREAYDRRASRIHADHAAWATLVERAGSTTAMLTLYGEGRGEPLPEVRAEGTTPDGRPATYITPARWATLDVTASLDGQSVDLPLIVEDRPGSDFVDIFLTDEKQEARILLGPLSRVVEPHAAYYDNRLFRIEEDNAL